MIQLVTSVVVLALLVSTLSGLPVDDNKQGQHPVQSQSSHHNDNSNPRQPLHTGLHQQPQGSLHTSASTSEPGRKTRDTASQGSNPPSLLGSQSSTTTEQSENSHLSSSLSSSTENRRVREADNSYSHQDGSSGSNTHPSQAGQSGSLYGKEQALGNSGYHGSSQSPYGNGQTLSHSGYQGSSQSSSDYGRVHPLGSGSSQSGQSSYSHLGAGVPSSSTENSSNAYASRNH